jgi:hypothetical protein
LNGDAVIEHLCDAFVEFWMVCKQLVQANKIESQQITAQLFSCAVLISVGE